MRLALVTLGAAAALLAPWPGRACSVCGCGDPLLSASDPAALTGQLRLQLDAEYLRVDAANDANPAATDQLTQWSYRLNVAWRPLEDLSLSATLPWVQKVIRTVGPDPTVKASDQSGLGDAEVAARWAFWRSVQVGLRRVQELAVSAGSSLPTGRHDARDAAGNVVDPHGQLGIGGWGPFAGLHYRLELGDFTTFASVSYRYRTGASSADPAGTFRYQFGDAFLWSVHGQYLVARRVALDLGVDGRRASRDRATDPDGTVTRVGNTGGTVLSLAPGLYVNAIGSGWLFVRAQVPFYQHLFDRQDVKPSVIAGVQVQAL
jgi:hypothetical protein